MKMQKKTMLNVTSDLTEKCAIQPFSESANKKITLKLEMADNMEN